MSYPIIWSMKIATRFMPRWASALCLVVCVNASATPEMFQDAIPHGSTSRLSLVATLTPDSAHVGKDLRVFALAWVPGTWTSQGPQGHWFARSSLGWAPLPTGQPWPELMALPEGVLQHPVTLLAQDDMRPVLGAQVHLGYGVSSGDTASAAAEMLAQNRHRLVYTVNQSPSDAGRANTEQSLQVSNEASLRTLLATLLRSNSSQTGGVWTGVGITTGLTSPGTAPAPSADVLSVANVSGTTLQEAGVDEDDLVKSDGFYVYNLSTVQAVGRTNSKNQLQRHRLNAEDVQLSTAESVNLPWGNGMTGTGLFLDAPRQQAVALAQGGLTVGIHDLWFAPGSYWASGASEVVILNTANRLTVKRHLRFSGALIGSRRIGDTLYLLLRSYPNLFSGSAPLSTATSASGAQSYSQNITSMLPTLSLDAGPELPLVQAVDCLTPRQTFEAPTSADIITLVALDLATGEHRHAARCFVGATEAFYVSERNVYLATTRHVYGVSGRFPVYPSETRTDIHQFSLNGLEINYQGSGSVSGHLGFEQNRKSFRMGEHNGVLRVFTQIAQQFGGWIGMPLLAATASTDTVNRNTPVPNAPITDSPGLLSVLQPRNGTLETVGELPNIRRPTPLGKPGEQLYASRFIGNRGYLVTYRLIDPLYIIDLADPTDPKVLGELEVSGYSDYLFPLSENLLLGVGKDAIADGGPGDGRAAWYQGVKLSLIDLSNPAQPVEAARSTIGRRGTDATVLRQHHGIAMHYRPGSVRVALPVSLRNSPTPYTSDKPSDHYAFTQNELQKFDVDLTARTLTQKEPLRADSVERDISHDRAVIWNDQVHHHTGERWMSGTW